MGLFDDLGAGPNIDEFLDLFPGVTRDEVESVLTHQTQSLENSFRSSGRRLRRDHGSGEN